MLKFVLIIGLALLHAVALIYTLLIWKPNPKVPFIFLCLSTTIFSCLCVDLARDQLQNIAYYPVTNAIFLITFTLCCILSSLPSKISITKYWPFIQLIALIIYLLHEQYIIRQILYRILDFDNSLKGGILVLFGILSCLIVHVGCGTMLKILLNSGNQSNQMKQANQELQSMVDVQNLQNAQQIISRKINRPVQRHELETTNYLQQLFSSFQQLPQIIKASLILGPPMLDFFSYIIQFFTQQKNHNHSHTHTHYYFSNSGMQDGMYFQDLTSQSTIGMVMFAIRIICSAIVFHAVLKIWSKQVDKVDKNIMKGKYRLAFVGFCVAVGRMLAERM